MIVVDHNGVEGACGGREVLPISLLTRPGSDHGWSCERVNVQIVPVTSHRTSYCCIVVFHC